MVNMPYIYMDPMGNMLFNRPFWVTGLDQQNIEPNTFVKGKGHPVDRKPLLAPCVMA